MMTLVEACVKLCELVSSAKKKKQKNSKPQRILFAIETESGSNDGWD